MLRPVIVSLAAAAVALTALFATPRASEAPSDPLPPLARPGEVFYEPNAGQFDPAVRFVARSASGTTFITPTGAVLARRGAWFELQVAGAAAAEPVGEGLLGTRLNYFLGSQPSRWRFGVPAVARVRQSELRPGVALLFHSEGARPELDLELQPGVDAEGVQLALAHFEGIEVEPSGALAVTAGAERFVLRKPRVYQQVDGTRREIAAAYRLLGPGRVGFEVGAHDPRLALVIDPVLETSTCFGGGNYENGAQLALDASGAPVFIGSSDSSDYPVVAPLQATPAGSSDLVLTKLNATASGVVFSTWLGGDNIEISGDIALDASGAIYVAGTSFSDDYPRVGAFQSTNAFGDSTGVVTKLAANGASIIYSTYLGGTLDEAMRGIAVDSSGNAVVCGETRSTNFPLASAAQAAPSGMLDGFVARLSPSGASLVFSTYLGGLDSDSAADCAVDPSGNVYVTGYATSGFPTTAGAFQTAMSGGSSNDGFVVKLSTTGGRTWASLLGGDGDDQAAGLAVDAAGRVTVTGRTNSVDFPTTAGSYQPQKLLPITTGNSDVFVSRFTPAGDALIFSTFLGGSVGDEGYAIALDAAGSAYITGYTDSLASAIRFPQVAAAFVPAQSGGAVFVTRLRPDGAALLHSMLIGGSDQNDYSHAIAVSPSGRTWVGGDTLSADYPTRSPVQPTCVNRELFITQLRPALAFTSLTPTYGTAGGGTTVSLWGELPPGSVVRFGGTAATGYTVVDLAHATAVTPARPQGFIDVTVTGPDGGVNTVVNGFRYVSPPSISAVTPPFGAAGTALAITGSNFYPEASVTLGGVAGASVTVVDAGLIRVVAPANSMGPHDLVVTNLPGFSATATAGFTYVPAPGLTSLSQPFGPAAGGTAVTATGSGFRAGVTVTVGGAPATGVMLLSATQLSFVTPARALGAASVVVTNLDGQSGTLSGGFTYVPPATVLQVVPPQGPTTGGTNLTVKGIGFQPGAALLFDATPLSAAYVDSTTLTSTAPASPARRVTVTVRNSDGQSGSLDAGFTYVSGPGITGVSPSTGPVAGGKTVTLTGFAFQSGLTVSFGGVAATTTRFTSATEVTAVAPAHGAGTVDIGVVNLDGQPGGLPAAFTYVTPPTLISIAPQSGPAGGGTRVTLRGAGFSEVASVTFGGAPATDVVKVDATTVQATAPAHAAGTVDVTLTDAEGQASTLAAGYQLVAAPALTSITPNNGSTLGGTTVTLTGTDFSSQAQVSFGSTAAVGVTVTSATSLTAVTPQHEEGQTDVTVSNPDGQRDTLSLGFTFAVPGCATSSDCAGGRCVAGVC